MASPLPARPKLQPGPTRHVYDVTVIGGQLGGLLSACLLAKRGYRVLCVEHDGVGGGYEHGGFVLPYGPFLAPTLKAMPGVDEAFTELGLHAAYQRALRSHLPQLQLILEDERVDLHGEPARRQRELARAIPGDAAPVLNRLTSLASSHEQSDAFFKAPHPLPPDGLLERWKLRRQASNFKTLDAEPAAGDSSMEKLVLGLLPFVTNLEKSETPLARVRALSQALAHPGRLERGRETLRELLEKRLVELGGDYLHREGAESYLVEQLVFEGGKLEGVRLLKSETIYRASATIAATDSGALRRLLPDKKKHRKLTERLDASELKSFLFAVNHVLPAEALPRGMGELLLIDSGDAELGPLLVQLHAARRADGKDDERLRVVSAAAIVPASARELGETHLESIAQRIDGVLERLMPFTRSLRVLSSAPYLHAAGVRGSRLMPHPHFDFEEEKALGVGGLPQRTPVKNLFLANRENLPGLGVEGELLAGIRAGQLVQELLHKKNPLK